MPSKLSPYTKKRNLKKSGEPKAIVPIEKKSPTKELIFTIHEHHASLSHDE